jgi:ubiquinone/menaquinone biosynthesis C-methylase UbiE
MTQQIDAEAVKQQHRDDWDRAAPRWRKFDEQLRRTGEPITRRLLELAGIQPGHRVLDIASGTGEPGLPAAEMAGPSGFVLLTDQSPEMLAVARDKARVQGLQNVDFRVCDAEQLQLEPETFDAALCRGALPLMPNPVAVLRVAYQALKPGGRIALTVVGRPQANPYFTLPYTILRKYVSLPRYDPSAPGPLYFTDPENLRAALAEAGFRELHVEPLEHTSMEFESGREYWEYSRGFSAMASVLGQIPADQHDKIGEEIAAAAAGGNPDGKAALKGESIVALGVK